MENSDQPIAITFGLNLPLALVHAGLALWFVTGVFATIIVSRKFRGRQLFGWILVCWLIPVLGPILSVACARRASYAELAGK